MLSPKRVKYRKQMRRINRRIGGVASRNNKISFGDFAMVALVSGFISSRQIEATRISLTRRMHRGGKVWIRVFPDYPFTKKPAETRMGSGKGSFDRWLAPVRAGQVLFEITGVSNELAQEAIELAIGKLPIKAKFIKRGVH